MVAEPLSDELKRAGAAVLREMDDIGLAPQGVLWLHFHHLNDWRLTVVSDLVDEIGRRKVYDLIGLAVDRHGAIDGLTVFDIHLASPDEVMPRILGGAINVSAGEVTISNCNINGLLVDAFVYRLVEARPTAYRARGAKQFQRQIKELTATG